MKRVALALLAVLFATPVPSNAQQSVIAAVTTNHSAVIVTGATFQVILAKAFYRSVTIQNNNTNTDNCWLTFGKTAGGTTITISNADPKSSILLSPGQSFTRYFPYIPYDEIEGTCTTTNDTLYVDTQ